MLVLNLIQNVALLVALAVAYQIILARWRQNHLKHQILAGLLFGVVGVVGMMTPVHFLPGIIFDGRSIILSVAGLFGGPLVALIAALSCGAYRLALGGAGAAMGVCVIAEAAALGGGFHYLRRRMTRPPGVFSLWVFGLLVHVLMLGCAGLLPEAGRHAFWRQLGVVVIVLYPVATMLVCMLFLDYEKQERDRTALEEGEARYRTTLHSIGDAVITTDVQGRVGLLNSVGETLTGWKSDDARGQPLDTVFRIINEDTRQPVENPVAKVLRAGMVVGLANHTLLVAKDGAERPIADSGAPIRDEQAKIIGVVLVFRDQTEERAAANALRRSEERYRRIVETAHEGIWCIDAESRTSFVNRRMQEILGYEAREMLARPLTDFLRPEDVADHATQLEARRQGKPGHFERQYRHANGEWRWMRVSATPQQDEQGRFLGSFAMFTDITEHRRAEAFREALLSLAIGLSAASTPAEVARSVFAGADRLWNWDAGVLDMVKPGGELTETVLCLDVLGGQRCEVPPAQPPGPLTPRMRRVLANGPELVLRTPEDMKASDSVAFGDTTRLSASIMCVPIRQRGQPVGVLSIQSYTRNAFTPDDLQSLQGLAVQCSGALERIQAEARLSRQAALLDAANDAIYVRALDQTVTYWNAGAERLYGWSRNEALGRKIIELADVDHAAFEAAQTAVLEHGSWSGELKHSSKTGKNQVAFCHWTLLRDEQDQPSEILAIHTDITEKKQLETQFLRAQRMEGIGSLAGGVAHDLNNILAPILMSTSLLREAVRDPESREMINTVETCAQRGADIIKQLLTFARGKPGARVPLPLRQLLREMDKIIGETFPRNLQRRIAFAPELWPVLGDPTQIHQALMNLCVNARDAMPEGGTLTLAAENVTFDEAFAGLTPDAKPGNYVCLSVSDTGTGIPADQLDRIFDPFFTTKAIGKGTGLGLPTVLGIVRGHGGFVRVNSQVGRGTTIELYLPAVPDAKGTGPTQAEARAPRGQGELILVVDDEAGIRSIVQRTLEKHGYRVLLASEGAEALARFAPYRGEVRAVLTDMMMPGMDGPALVRALRQVDPRLPILGMTGLAERVGVSGLESLDLPVVLTKPFPGVRLLAALHEALATRSAVGVTPTNLPT